MPDLTSGAVGLALGGVIGLILSVLFEDGMKKMVRRIGFRLRNMIARGELPADCKNFALGPLRTDLLIVEGDGEQVIDEQSIDIHIDPTEVDVPPEIQEWRQEIKNREHKNRAEGRDFLWNGLNYAVVGFTSSRIGLDETPSICLTFKSSDYFTFAASQQFDRRLRDGTTLRERYLGNADYMSVPEFISSSFGINIAVVTADNMVLFSQRSGRVGMHQYKWSSSANEALSRSLDNQGRSAPDLYDVARRGLMEELALDKSQYRLEMLAVTLDRGLHQWGCLFVAFLRTMTTAEWFEQASRGVPDKFEHMNHEFVRFRPRDVVEHLLSDGRRNSWTPTAPGLFYLALVRQYGRRQVESEAALVIRRLNRPRSSAGRRLSLWRTRLLRGRGSA